MVFLTSAELLSQRPSTSPARPLPLAVPHEPSALRSACRATEEGQAVCQKINASETSCMTHQDLEAEELLCRCKAKLLITSSVKNVFGARLVDSTALGSMLVVTSYHFITAC